MGDINFNTVPVVSAINNSDYLHITTGGSHRRVLVSNLIAKAKADALTEMEANLLDRLTEGCFIFYVPKAQATPFALYASQWTAQQNSGEKAIGVLVCSGGRHLVVAPDEYAATGGWGLSSTLVAPNGEYSSDRMTAMSMFNGKARTAAVSGAGTNTAIGICQTYGRVNDNGRGLPSGSWWLPSLGELFMFGTMVTKINACLQLITDATLISYNSFWSSTEASSENAWDWRYGNNYVGLYSKTRTDFIARPVSEFKAV